MSVQKAVLIHNIGVSPSKQHHIQANYNTQEQVERAQGLLTFDGIYKNVYDNRHLLKGRDVILFVMGDYIGKDNSFDKGMPLEQYCSLKELNELANMGCKIGWHTWSHPDLTQLSDEEILREITPPDYFPRDYFAYPYGRWDERVKNIVASMFKSAYSVHNTDGSEFTIPRDYL